MTSLEAVSAEDDWYEPSSRKSKKKTHSTPSQGASSSSSTSTTSSTIDPTNGESHGADEVGGPKLLSKKEKEKLRKQRQKQAEKAHQQAMILDLEAMSEPTATSTSTSTIAVDEKKELQQETTNEPTPSNPTKSKKKGNKGMTIALLQQMMAEQRAAEEAERKRLEEEKRKEEELIKLREEEERKKEEERQLKKEKERLRKEQLKKEGKLLTKAQKEKELKNKQRLEQLLLMSGVQIPAITQTTSNTNNPSDSDAMKPNFKKDAFRQRKKSSATPSTSLKEDSLESNASLATGLSLGQEGVVPELKQTSSTSPSSFSSSTSATHKKKKSEPSQPIPQASEKNPSKKNQSATAIEKEKKPKQKEIEKEKKQEEEVEDVKASWEDESDHEEEKTLIKPAPKFKSAWDESSDEEEKEKKKTLISKQLNKQSKSEKVTTSTPQDSSINKPSSTPSDSKSEKSSEVKEKKKKGKVDKNDLQSENANAMTSSVPSSTQPNDTSNEPHSNATSSSTMNTTSLKKSSKPKPSTSSSSSPLVLRSPICCILGHVDTGKTKLLDKIRQTNVQDGEAGGITQQIGATYFPVESIQQKIQVLKASLDIKVPGLLIIDTPGHESFTNLRTRGSSLCNMAILVVDIMHGLEPQTLESLELLRQRKTPFIVALNKIDRLYNWKAIPNNSFVDSMQQQSQTVKNEFEKRLNEMIVAFAEQGLNARLYSENENMGKFVSIVPTSAITGEGIPDMLYLLIHLTQTRMSEKIKYVGELEATVLEVKVVEGLGTTIDVILSNGVLHESDTIVVCGLEGPIVTHIRALLTPQPMRELRVKSQYVHHKRIQAAMGVKISANGLEKAVAGSRLLVLKPGEDEEAMKEEIMEDLKNMLASVDKSGKGVWVQASTLGSLEALLSFLKSSDIPVAGMHIGPVHKKDVMKASIMLERAKEFAVMLCFDVKIDKDAQELADDMGVKIFKADIIYHLFDQFTAYYQALVELKRKDAMPEAVFPCILKMVPGALFNKRDPIVIGVDVVEGVLRIGTPICVLNEDQKPISLGKVTSMEHNHKSLDIVKKGQASVAIKIECPSYEHPKMFGRHFNEKSELYSLISRQSIDILKENFKHEMDREYWALVIKLKNLFGII